MRSHPSSPTCKPQSRPVTLLDRALLHISKDDSKQLGAPCRAVVILEDRHIKSHIRTVVSLSSETLPVNEPAPSRHLLTTRAPCHEPASADQKGAPQLAQEMGLDE